MCVCVSLCLLFCNSLSFFPSIFLSLSQTDTHAYVWAPCSFLVRLDTAGGPHTPVPISYGMALRGSGSRLIHAPSRELDALWMRSVGVKPNAVRQEVRRDGGDAGGSAKATAPVRCMVASRNIARGECVCVVPPEFVLTGRLADQQLRQLARSAASREANGVAGAATLRGYGEVVKRLHAMPSVGRPSLLASRDGLLITALLYLYRSLCFSGLVPPSPLAAWVRTMPRRVPPLGLLLAEHLEHSGRHTPLEHRLSLGSATVPLQPGEDARAAATQLMVAAVEEKGLAEGLRSPRREVVLTASMLADFHAGRRTALTPRQFDAAAAHTLRYGKCAAVRQLALMEAELRRHVLVPLLRALSPTLELPTGGGGPSMTDDEAFERNGADPCLAAELEAMEWAHFTLRSRALNLRYRRGPAELSLIPFLDRLNHSSTGANITFTCQDSGKDGEETTAAAVTVTASRSIQAGEELLLHYGHVGQRGCLFGDRQRAVVGEGGSGRRASVDAVAHEVRSIEAKQRHEWVVDEDAAAAEAGSVCSDFAADTHCGEDPSSRGRDARRSAAELQSLKEVVWLWRYGFLRSERERAYEASHQWSKGLRDRLAHLTDVRRKGAPGAFVVGVPEGLEHLRTRRESLERERYGNTRVFPPQQA